MFAETIIVGNLGGDPIMRFTAGGTPVTSFSVATSRSWTGADGQRQEQTTWYRVSAWDKIGESCNQYLKKGHRVLVKGELREPNVWTDQNGNARASLEMRASNVRFLTSRAEAEGIAGALGSSNGTGEPAGAAETEEDIPF